MRPIDALLETLAMWKPQFLSFGNVTMPLDVAPPQETGSSFCEFVPPTNASVRGADKADCKPILATQPRFPLLRAGVDFEGGLRGPIPTVLPEFVVV